MFNKIFCFFNPKFCKEHQIKWEELKSEHEQKLRDLEIENARKLEEVKPKEKLIISTPVKVEKKKISKLKITFTDNSFISWNNSDDIKYNQFHWKDFFKWYLTKTTPLFVFKHKNGQTIIRRDLVKLAEVNDTIYS